MDKHHQYLQDLLVQKFGEQEGLRRFETALVEMKIDRFVQDIEPENRPARVFGQPQHLVGKVCNFNKNIHLIKPFEIPTDWPVTVMIDVHPSKPMAALFMAVDPRRLRYGIAEIYANMPPEALGDKIVKMKRAHQWRLEEAYIDPLAKGDEKFAKNRLGDVDSSYTILEDIFIKHDILLQTATKDRDNGVIAINRGLKSLNNMPNLFFFNTLDRTIWEIGRWVYIDGSAKDPDKHMMENLYRYMILKIEYIAPQNIHGKQNHTDPGVV